MKIISFNANGLRARIHQIKAIIEKHQPDVIGIQETKVSDDQFPLQAIKELGYDVSFHGQKGHYGVALIYRVPLIKCYKGFPHDDDDSQKRLIIGDFQYKNKKIQGYQNDVLIRDGNTNNMVYSIEKIIEWLSSWMTLNPGDIILSGAPPRVRKKQFLKSGDIYSVQLEGFDDLNIRVL